MFFTDVHRNEQVVKKYFFLNYKAVEVYCVKDRRLTPNVAKNYFVEKQLQNVQSLLYVV